MSAEAESLERSVTGTDPDGVSGRVRRDRSGSGAGEREADLEPETLADGSLLPPECAPTQPSLREDELGVEDAPELPAVGEKIGDNYRITHELGRGGMGVVLCAIDERLERRVAIKLIRRELLKPGFRERFMAEARAMARVNHPNVLCIHAFGEHESVPYFVMEHVAGHSLDVWLSSHREPIDLETKLAILNDVCNGVSAIHAAGTIHRDVKPSNILVDETGRARITDFGVSTSETAEDANEVVGTPAYMAPEIAFSAQYRGQPNPSSDVYSLACVAFELLTGVLPFDAESAIAIMLKHATVPPPAPSSLCAELSPAYDRVFAQALEKNPSARTPTVEQFRRALLDAHKRGLEPVRIVVAEDDDDFRDVLEIKLRMEFPDADIECVADGAAALAALERKPASVAIFDLCMPVLDGLALTRAVRASPASANMPIVVLTASGGASDWERLSSMGADRLLVKPANLDDVTHILRHAIRERNAIPASG
jgi:CheY-like chemotaxis protein